MSDLVSKYLKKNWRRTWLSLSSFITPQPQLVTGLRGKEKYMLKLQPFRSDLIALSICSVREVGIGLKQGKIYNPRYKSIKDDPASSSTTQSSLSLFLSLSFPLFCSQRTLLSCTDFWKAFEMDQEEERLRSIDCWLVRFLPFLQRIKRRKRSEKKKREIESR